MKRTLVLFALLTISLTLRAQPLRQPFEFVMPSWDSTHSDWLPAFGSDSAGGRGFLRPTADGHLEFEDGTPVRFAGVTVQATACFPDSVAAIATASRLRKLGVNMVRFDYFDYHNFDAASVLAPGNRSDTLAPAQMKKLDWFLYQLKRNGIYAHMVLKARNGPRRNDSVPGWDSTYNSGLYITHFNEPHQRMQRRVLTQLMTHRNPYTSLRYADDPAIALLTVVDGASIFGSWVNDNLNQRSSVLSYHHSRLLDTMFTQFLRRRYPSTTVLKDVYWEGLKTVAANSILNPGFESYTDNWELSVGEGAQASAVIVQGPDVAPGEDASSLRVVVRQSNGNESRIYLQQNALAVRRDGIYRFRFKAKTDAAAGRQIRVYFFRSGGSLGMDTSVALTTAWQTYQVIFRSPVTDSIGPNLRVYIGRSMGDVFLDGFSLQETGREGLGAEETLETFNIARAKFRDAPRISLRRMLDLSTFYDSLGRAYYRTMRAHLRSLGVRALLSGTNANSGGADTWVQSEHDFTSRTAQWDFNGSRATGIPYSDSTWVIRNYSILTFRDQRVPDFARGAIWGKPFIAEGYGHVAPNAHRAEMMLYYPAYAMLHGWDGAYLMNYSDRATEMADRRRVIKDDFTGFMADPSICALLPHFSAIIRDGLIAPAERTIRVQYDRDDLLALPLTYFARGTFDIDGSFSNVSTMVGGVRADSFEAKRHYTATDYYFTVPEDDRIDSDTRQISRDMTKGLMTVNAPRVQGGSGMIGTVSSLRTDNLAVSWIEGGAHVTWLWTPLDSQDLSLSGRSLLTITTRALNGDAAWQYGDSSLGKNWGAGPVVMEGAKVGLNFYTDADSIVLHPLDTLAAPTGRTIGAVRSGDSWRAVIDLSVEGTPWFGVEQIRNVQVGVDDRDELTAVVGEPAPNPAVDFTELAVTVPEGAGRVVATVHDLLGNPVASSSWNVEGRSTLPIDVRALPSGVYTVTVQIGSQRFMRRIVVAR